MLETITRYWKALRDGKPGNRFRHFYDFRKQHRLSTHIRIGTIVLGIGLIVLGLSIGWLPGPGGFIAIFGIALLSQQSRTLVRLLDHAEVWIRSCWRWFKRLPVSIQVGTVAVSTLVGACLVYGVFTWLR